MENRNEQKTYSQVYLWANALQAQYCHYVSQITSLFALVYVWEAAQIVRGFYIHTLIRI